ncbi:MAG: hypothetical protein K2Y51_18660 [Gammaproteobacteria bacterium]|nr:hypothetical protein [Gammaproteobacteria bacterium]
MLDRRTFLTGALSATLLAPALARARVSAASTVRVVVDGGCEDARAFARACGLSESAHQDAASLAATLEDMRETACVGLGRDSQVFVLTRLLASRGYRPVYEGRHELVAARTRHTLRGARDAVRTLATALADAGDAWPRWLATAAPRLAHAASLEQATARTVSGLAARGDGPGLLVSWCLLRA